VPSSLVPRRTWPQINPGEKRHKIAIHAASSVRLPGGELSVVLGTVAWQCYAAIDTFTKKDVFQDGFNSQVYHNIWIDYPRVVILANMTVVVHPENGPDANQYNVETVENVQERSIVMLLTCLEIDNKLVGA
jgi:hypothetical protein